MCAFIFNLLLILLGLTSFEDQKFTFHEENEGILLIYDNQNIFFYQRQTKSYNGRYSRANYIHPLYGLNGEVLTEDFPEDHLHHRGIFWAWHQLYVRDKKVGDPWACEGITWNVKQISTDVYADSAVMKVLVSWEGNMPGNLLRVPEELIREETVISCSKKDKERLDIHFDIRLSALHEGTRIGGSEDNKGYSGFSIRTKLPDDLTFFSNRGEVIPEVTAIQAGGWIDMHGTFDPDHEEQTAIAIMCNPNDPKPFHGWILRDKGSMQNAAFPGRNPVSIPRGESLRMQYKILLHRKNMPKNEIDNIYRQFISY